MRVKFTSDQFEFLQVNLKKDNPDLYSTFEAHKIEPLVFELDDFVMEEVRNWAMDKQVFLGFDVKYNLNQKGLILEELIDLLYL